MSVFWIAQIVGALGVIFSLCIYQLDRRSSMLRLSSFASILYAIQFIFLHAYSGAAMNIVAAIRNYTFFRIGPTNKNLWLLYIFMALGLLATVLTWQGGVSLLPLFGNWSNALATWQKNTKWMRRFALLAPPLWIIYSLFVHSYPGIFIEIVILCSNILGQYRFDFNRQKSLVSNLDVSVQNIT